MYNKGSKNVFIVVLSQNEERQVGDISLICLYKIFLLYEIIEILFSGSNNRCVV